MGKQSTIKILSFHRRRTNANGWYRLDFIFQRGKKILHYTLSTQDYEYSECFCSPSHIERADMIVFVAELLLEIHKVKYSCLKRTPSQAYATSKYISRINQICKKNHYHKTPVIIDGL
ncbi:MULTISPECIES: hypothetical protein [Bacteroides]|jgi:hypothetical protein|uniref:Uncharacterized protein n=1 Tax=Bacteroides fragilis TaxID=817 RepID=A0A412YQF0_BACFG|nr:MULTISPECIES: hypothetical protein [Bacteroides]MCM0217775.1 hypothetical protein [Bacteroides fragilis]MCM0244896.1 hypothetical protein [Bacteroides fragilis]MCM0249490.1 hypothetical protein [Bacteroides fragilis]MCM0254650.1 hypothetical protein [Bacteroides fragilis]MCM0257550.1 hypothetical protein [Bacteroides fragilis]